MRWLPVFLGVAVSLGTVMSTAAGPRLVAPLGTFDFGAVERGTRVEHVFKVRNDGDAPAAIRGIDRACACTIGAGSAETLAPGRELWVSVGLDTSRLGGATAKAVTLRTDDPQTPTLRLVIQGTVLSDLLADPPILYVGEVRRGREVERSAGLRPGRPAAPPPHVIGVTARGPFVIPRVIEDGRGGVRITVRVAKDAPPGRFRDEIVVRTSEAQSALIMPVLGVVQAEEELGSRAVVARVATVVRR
jgi:hypothetical protein